MNRQLRISPFFDDDRHQASLDLIESDDETFKVIATVYYDAETEEEARKAATLFANAAWMYELLLEIHIETTGKVRALNYDRWLRDVMEIVRRIEEGA